MNTTFARYILASAFVGYIAAPAIAATQTFDTPTATTLTTETTYGMKAGSHIALAEVTAGQLRLTLSDGINGNFTFGAFADDLTFDFDTTISGSPGTVNVGYSAGTSQFYFHPGFWSSYFISPLGVTGNMGFTPDASLMTHVTVDIKSATKNFSVTLENGSNAYSFSYVDASYVPGTSLLGFTAGSVPGTRYAAFDNLTVTAVPEPETYATLLAGLGLLGAITRRRKARQG